MKKPARIAFHYSLIAALATAANLGSQMAMIWLYSGPRAVELSILVGTAVGLPIKYVLEKRHIFNFEARSLAHDSRVFVVYSLMGVVTTIVFWGTEYVFHLVFGTDLMRYVGGAIGLTVGYYVKYLLDKHYVFIHREPAGVSG